MGRRSAVERLEEKEFDFVIKGIIDGKTDREISIEFESSFDGKKLPKSNINNWRNKAGRELAERYQLARFQAKQLREDLKLEDGDDYQNIIKTIEERLLTATREVVQQNPIKLLFARQEEERLRLKREKLELDKSHLEFEREKHKSSVDRVKLGAEFLQDLFEYLKTDAEGIRFLSTHLQPFEEFLKAKYDGTES